MKHKDLEFRHLESRDAEIVRWVTDNLGKSYCFTVLFYERDSEGYQIRFVGDRPLRYDDRETMWAMMKYGQSVMDAKWDIEELQK